MPDRRPAPAMRAVFAVSLLLVVAMLLLPRVSHGSSEIGKRRAGSRRTVLAPRILYMEHCKDGRKHALRVHNYSALVDAKGLVYLNTAMSFLRPAKSFTMMKLVLHKCTEAVTSNTCEYFATWPFTTAICTMMTTKGMMWSGFMRKFDPEFKCPMTPGLYTLENATVDVSLGETLAHVNIAGNVWNVEVSLTDENRELYTCLNTAVLINRVNVKD